DARAAAMRTVSARIEMVAAARLAAGQRKHAFMDALPVRSGDEIRERGGARHALSLSENQRAVDADDPAVPVRERELRARDLAFACLPAQLAHRLDHVEHASGEARMYRREQPAVRRHRERAARADPAAFDEAAAFALGAKAEVLELDDHGDGEAIVELGDVDLLRPDARRAERFAARLHRAGGRDLVVLADVGMRKAVALAEQSHRRLL